MLSEDGERPRLTYCTFTAKYSPETREITYAKTDPKETESFAPERPLGRPVTIDEQRVGAMCRKTVFETRNVFADDSGTAGRIDGLRGLSLELAEAVMSDDVIDALRSALRGYDYVQLVTNLSCIPWELCHLGNLRDGGKYPSEIGCFCRLHHDWGSQRSQSGRWRGRPEIVVSRGAVGILDDRIVGGARDEIKKRLRAAGIKTVGGCRSYEQLNALTGRQERVYIIGASTADGIGLAEEFTVEHGGVKVGFVGGGASCLLGAASAGSALECHVGNQPCTCQSGGRLPIAFVLATSGAGVVFSAPGWLGVSQAVDLACGVEMGIRKGDGTTLFDAWRYARTQFGGPHWRFLAVGGSWDVRIVRK
jgi:hypothetical protein